MAALTVSEIWIYPVKSLGGIPLSSAMVRQKGIALDRRWMLVDADNIFMTQRMLPAMALFKLAQDDKGLIIRHGNDVVHLPESPAGEDTSATIWDDTVTVKEVDPGLSAWFSAKLNKECRLVAFPEDHPRQVDTGYAIGDDHVSLADAYPLLIIGQASLDDLNTRLDRPVPMNRFRPNIVFSGGDPYEEDNWSSFHVGNLRFAAVKRCARCVLTTVDQETAVKSHEPLATLSRYRKVNNKVYFGQNLIPMEYGEIRVGDPILTK